MAVRSVLPVQLWLLYVPAFCSKNLLNPIIVSSCLLSLIAYHKHRCFCAVTWRAGEEETRGVIRIYWTEVAEIPAHLLWGCLGFTQAVFITLTLLVYLMCFKISWWPRCCWKDLCSLCECGWSHCLLSLQWFTWQKFRIRRTTEIQEMWLWSLTLPQGQWLY